MWAVVSAGSMISATLAGRCGREELGRDASAMIPPSPDFDGAADRKHGRDIGSAFYVIVPDLSQSSALRRGHRRQMLHACHRATGTIEEHKAPVVTIAGRSGIAIGPGSRCRGHGQTTMS